MQIGGIAAGELARVYETPLLVIDLDGVDAAVTRLLGAAPASEFEVSYATKAFATIEFLRRLSRQPVGFDICSIGELVTAERAGIAAERLTLHGAGKMDEELQAAVAGRVGFITVDGIEELRRLATISRDRCRAAVLLRLNLGIDARTHEYVRTGGDDTKFGIHGRDETAALAILRANPHLRFAGLHAHIGSQIADPPSYLAAADALLSVAARFSRDGVAVQRIVIGGGFAVASDVRGEPSLDVPATVGRVRARIATRTHQLGIGIPLLGIEPGRAIVAAAGTTLYRVVAVKHRTHRTFVVVDGGIAENPRPALYGARHHVVSVAPSSGDEVEMRLCGRSCENDELGVVRLPREVRAGDLLAMCGTGAYTYSMASNYNRFPRPAVVGVAAGEAHPLARRESVDDVLRNDVDLAPARFESGSRAPAF